MNPKLSPIVFIRTQFQNRRARARRSGQTPTRKNTQDNFVTCQPSSIPSELESEINRLIDDENQTFNCLEPDVSIYKGCEV